MKSTTAFQSPATAQHTGVNPFARALAEARVGQSADQDRQPDPILQNMLGQTGGQFPSFDQLGQNADALSQADALQQQRQVEELRRAEQLKARRLELHRQVNPVDLKDVFSARERQIREELEKTRIELQALAKEIAAFHKDVDLAVQAPVVDAGQTGAYYRTFFQKLRDWIVLLRQKVHSARTWMKQMQTKRNRRGTILLGQRNLKGNDETTAVWNTMHHERAFGAQGAG